VKFLALLGWFDSAEVFFASRHPTVSLQILLALALALIRILLLLSFHWRP
jgi:hypothetical protein